MEAEFYKSAPSSIQHGGLIYRLNLINKYCYKCEKFILKTVPILSLVFSVRRYQYFVTLAMEQALLEN